MVKEKLYICRECGYVFPKELSEHIESNVQVYCEMCGTPFSIAGVEFVKPAVKYQRKPSPAYSTYLISDSSKSSLNKAIKTLNKFAYLPILIFSGIFLGFTFQAILDPTNWIDILVTHISLGICGVFIVIYDINHISPKIQNEEYNDILLDAFCFGILGCIIYGTGTLLLIKGLLILIYGIINPSEKEHKLYNFGIKLKNSINEFSAKAGFIIAILVIYGISIGDIDVDFIRSGLDLLSQRISTFDPWLIFIILLVILAGFCLIPLVILIIDLRRRKKLQEKYIFKFKDSFSTFILGIFGTAFFGIGFFILLKGILIFFLFAGKPSDIITTPKVSEEKEELVSPYKFKEEPKKVIYEEDIKKTEKEIPEEKPSVAAPEKVPSKDKEKEIITTREEVEVEKEEEQPPKIEEVEKEEKIEEPTLRLHESLLPVKDEKDKKIVKEYFSKIFAVISKDLRKQILELKIPKKDKKAILKELAFLTEQEQAKYIYALSDLYKEIPRKLIERIRKLPNVKPQYYDKIVEQLKYLDAKERINFIQFLEKNA